ncbi:MAG TPA: glycosyltransferase family A protein [Tepidisphaeraceae bacterium]|nr:glycosyltransferase family A protein [Tepidisphaeraceae bacterium]
MIGPLAWGLLFIGTLLGRQRMSRLSRWRRKLPDNPPSVSILIPAKDEGPGINRCIEAVLAQDHPKFDVITIDDRSTDDTGQILDGIAARDPRVKAVHIPLDGLPPGWLGKCHALHVGARQAAGDWLFFVDSDVTLDPNALSSALSICLGRQYDALSILTRLECHSSLERFMLPPLAAAWAIMHAVSLTNQDSRPDRAAANGQFFLIRRDAYEKVGGHEAVKDQITEDVEMMRLLKSHEYRVRLFSGAHLAATRMHSNLKQMFNGWARIYSGTPRRKPWRILWVIFFLATAVFSLYPAIGWGIYKLASQHDPRWIYACASHFILMTGYLAFIYHWSGGSKIRYALMIPVTATIMIAILLYSLRKCQTGKIVWRDTVFAPAQKQ